MGGTRPIYCLHGGTGSVELPSCPLPVSFVPANVVQASIGFRGTVVEVVEGKKEAAQLAAPR